MLQISKTWCILLLTFFLLFFSPINDIGARVNANNEIVPNRGIEPWWENWVRDQDHNHIDDVLDEKISNDPSGTENIYLHFSSRPDQNVVDLLKKTYHVSYECKFINVVCFRNVPFSSIPGLLSFQNVVMVELQGELVLNMDVSARAVKARPSEEYSPRTSWELGFTGKGINVAVLDTGVDDNHPALRGKFVGGYDCSGQYDFMYREGNPDDKNGHGTHCAGTIMGNGGTEGDINDRENVGVAPDANLVDVKVMTDIGPSAAQQLIIGIEWCIENKDRYDIRILSISIGSIVGNDDGSGADAQAANAAVEMGLVVVAAAGNDGTQGFTSVGSADKSITVGALDDMNTFVRDDDVIADYSNYGPRLSDMDDDNLDELKPDVVAPGTNIKSTGFASSPWLVPQGYQEMSGTSMACPHVAGICALMLEGNSALNSSEVKKILRKTTEPRGAVHSSALSDKYSQKYGFGMVDAYGALKEATHDYQLCLINDPEKGGFIGGSGYVIKGIARAEKYGNIEKVEISIDSQGWILCEGTAAWTYKLDTIRLSNGVHIIKARSNNGEKYSDIDQKEAIVNNVKIQLDNIKDGAVIKSKITIIGSCSGLNVEHITLQFGTLPPLRAKDASGKGDFSTWSLEFDTNQLKKGKTTLTVTAAGTNVYSTPLTVNLEVKNDNDKDSAPGFDPILIITVLVAISLLLKKQSNRNS